MIAIADHVIPGDTIDNRELSAVLWRRRWLITVSTVVCTALLTVLAFTMTPVYRGSAILVPANVDRNALEGGLGSALGGSVGGLAALAGFNFGSKEMVVEETIAVLKSRQFTESFVQRNNLMPELFHDKWDAQQGNWRVGVRVPTLNEAFRAFTGMRTVNRDSKTGLIMLSLDWTDRKKAAEWTNELVRELNDEMRGRVITESEASLGYLQKELSTTSEVVTRDAISRLMESQIKQRMLANVTQEYALRFVDRALVPDITDKVAPRKALMMAAGMLLGLVIGAGLALLLNVRELATRRRED